jgi:hypothetical protein
MKTSKEKPESPFALADGSAADAVTEMALCEVPRIFLRPGQLYRFVVMPGCKACEAAAATYSPNDQSPQPTFDADGYPTEETELAIKAWDFRDVPGWLAYIREAWNHHYGRMWEEGGMLKMATGGWSGNESITHAMRENHVLWALLWESSHRGGLEVLRMPNAEVSDGSGS